MNPKLINYFAGGLCVSLLAACAAETPSQSLSVPVDGTDHVGFDIPAPTFETYSGGDLAMSASASAPALQTVVYVGADSSDGPYSGFTPLPATP